MDVVLVGLPGSGKSAVGRRLAGRHHAAFIDLDELVELRVGRPVPVIFAEEGEAAFRRYEREAVLSLGPADPDPQVGRVIATGGGAVLTVVDDGPGIPPDERERVFERFTRLDDARDRDAGGTGLGLPIVRELLRRCDGSITLQDNSSGPGLAAVVTLPA